jgi:chaperonin cofactor prefoldin
MKETNIKAVTDAFIELKLGDIIERLDRRVSTLADRVATLETRQPTYEDTGHPEDEVYDAHGNIDHVAT